MTRKLILAFAVVAGLVIPASASADVYDGSMSLQPPATPRSLNPRLPETQTHRYTKTIAVSYDDVAGTLAFRVSVFDPQVWDAGFEPMAFSAGPVGGDFFMPNGSAVKDAYLQLSGYEGYVDSEIAFDGQTNTVTFQHPALVGLDIHSVTIRRFIAFETMNEGDTIWLASEADRRPQKPHVFVADNDVYEATWREKPKFWRIYPDNAPLCCGVTLHKLRWRNWGKPNAYATARTRVKTNEPWARVRVRAYGRTVIDRQGEPTLPDGEPARYTSYRYKYVKVTFPGKRTVKWTLDFPETE